MKLWNYQLISSKSNSTRIIKDESLKYLTCFNFFFLTFWYFTGRYCEKRPENIDISDFVQWCAKEIFFNTEKKCTCGLDILKKDIGISTTASVSSQRWWHRWSKISIISHLKIVHFITIWIDASTLFCFCVQVYAPGFLISCWATAVPPIVLVMMQL